MADKNINDFWADKDDDFWGKPVVTKDWLTNETTIENTGEDRLENPYFDREQPRTTQKYVNTEWSENSDKTKSFPVCRVISLIFFLFSVAAVAASVFAVSMSRQKADRINRHLDYEVVRVTEDSFPVYDNNTVLMEDTAYVIFGSGADQRLAGMPAGEKLVAVYVQVESEDYKSGQYALRDMFVGCKKGEQTVFRRCIRGEAILSALSYVGFQSEEILSSFGIGNGRDEGGYYFFYVPEELQTITLYVEERSKKSGISVLDKRYEKELQLIESVDIQELLDGKREG